MYWGEEFILFQWVCWWACWRACWRAWWAGWAGRVPGEEGGSHKSTASRMERERPATISGPVAERWIRPAPLTSGGAGRSRRGVAWRSGAWPGPTVTPAAPPRRPPHTFVRAQLELKTTPARKN